MSYLSVIYLYICIIIQDSELTTFKTLLSLILPSCIIVFNRELANNFSFSSSNTQSSQIIFCSTNQINIDMEKPRDCLISSSSNTFRKPSTHSNISSMDYAD